VVNLNGLSIPTLCSHLTGEGAAQSHSRCSLSCYSLYQTVPRLKVAAARIKNRI